jgi:hypothetical protein
MSQFPTVSLRRHYVRLPSETHPEGALKRDLKRSAEWKTLRGAEIVASSRRSRFPLSHDERRLNHRGAWAA